MKIKRLTAAAAVCALALTTQVTAAAETLPGCAEAAPGGEWPSYGGSLDNARNQTAELTIGPENANSLEPKWVLDAAIEATNGGGFSSTPVVADGCVYIGSNTGVVFAVNAESGDVVWQTKLEGRGQALLGGVIVGSPAVGNGLVYLGVSNPGNPYVAALDQATGVEVWRTIVEHDQRNALINASPVLFGDMVFMGFAGHEGGDVARGGFAILDAISGELLDHTYTIPDADYEAGYRGASVWCTASVDVETKYVYACGGNPASKKIEHRHSNALLKIDAAKARDAAGNPVASDTITNPRFGDIVDAFKGSPDQYYPGLERQPICDMFGEELVYVAWSAACLQLDLDFGASPNLFTDSQGRKLVGALQKSGVYFAVWADNMQQAWTNLPGAPCFACNAASTAFDGQNVYMGATPPGQMVALGKDLGGYRWVSPIADGIHFHSTSTANGVVYSIDSYGFVNGFDAATGVPVLKRQVSQDVGTRTTDFANSSGVAIARNSLYAAVSGYVIAYELPPSS